MPMSSSTLKTEILAAIDGLSEAQLADKDAFWDALAGAIIDHIVANGKVTIAIGGVVVDPGTHANLVPVIGSIS